MENLISFIKSIFLPIILWIFKPKQILRILMKLQDSKAGKYIFKTFAILGFICFIAINFATSFLAWLKYGLTINGFYISFIMFVTLFGLTTGYFYLTFMDLFSYKNNNKHKPFSIV